MRKCIYICFLLLFLAACTEPPSKEETDQFNKDVETVLNILDTAYSANRELNYEEERELVTFGAYYGSDSDFYKGLKDSEAKLAAQGLLLMESTLSKDYISVGGETQEEEYNDYKKDVESYLNNLK
ncbi:hypothetical protein [Fictibacillus nanhaiensis]|uniref:hypothetical protein n=1 Tax=Fictibacillus nanhaiensis TaxID=742169 RepID=UPI003C1CBBC8